MAKKSLVDPDTGYTPEEQMQRFKEVFGIGVKQSKVVKKPETKKPKVKKKEEPVDLKKTAVALYEKGKDAKQVAEALNISYASAYYYKKFVGQEKAKERLKMALKRI